MKHIEFYFIVDWPTKLKPFYILEHEKKSELSKSFDLQYGYLEIVSGGTREHDSARLKNKLQEKGLNPNSFSNHLQTFEWGMPPHSGCGLALKVYDDLNKSTKSEKCSLS